MDRRDYTRLVLNVNAVLFKQGEELSCVITNISEQGIGIQTKASKSGVLKVNDAVQIVFIDTFNFGTKPMSTTNICKAKIMHIEKLGSLLKVGCFIHDPAYIDYVRKRKFSDYYTKVIERGSLRSNYETILQHD